MRTATLLGQLLRIQVLVVVLACSLLVFGALGTGGFLLRRGQDQDIQGMATGACHGILQEQKEDGVDLTTGAMKFFDESRREGYRFELRDERGVLLAAAGDPLDGSGGAAKPSPADACWTPGGSLLLPQRIDYRICERECVEGGTVRVTTRDVLSRAEVRRAAGVLLAALPVSILSGALIGLVLFRQRLRPLQELQEAATRLEAQPDVALRTAVDTEELVRLEHAFNGLLSRLGEALAREKRFSQEASHELRTPLTVLRGRLEQLAHDLAARPDLAREARAAVEDVESLDRLVGALLLLARSESAPLPMTPVNLCDLAREAARQPRLAEEPGSALIEVEAPDEILVRGSEELLGRALGNLLENARKFGGAGARISIRVHQQKETAILCVEDNGPGIPPEQRPLVFERFFRSPSERQLVQGTGLGLAVVRAIVARHRGEVTTGPSVLGGERVRILLPALAPTPESPLTGEDLSTQQAS